MDDDQHAGATATRWFFAFFLVFLVGAEAADFETDLQELTAMAWARHPAILAVREQVVQADAARRELDGFFDPHLTAAGGSRWDPAAGTDGMLALGGAETALRSGAYVGMSAEQTLLRSQPGEHSTLSQTKLLAYLRIPLNRDRGFILWRLDQRRASAEEQAAIKHVLTVCQELRRDVELEYITLQAGFVAQRVAAAATERATQLLKQAEELLKLKAIPEYQLHPARLEVALRQEEEKATAQLISTSRDRLIQLLGGQPWKGAFNAPTPEALIAWVEKQTLPGIPATAEQARDCRGDYLEIADRLAAAEATHQRRREDMRPEVNVEIQGSWEGETADGVLGDSRYTGERNVGGQALLVWRRPLGYRAERARIYQAKSRMAELEQNMDEVQNRIRTELATAVTDYLAARERFALVAEAVKSARLTLAAEEDRFRLGEGRSRNVLDAQRDLTTTIQRQTTIGAELLRAVARYHYATGYEGQLHGLPHPLNPEP